MGVPHATRRLGRSFGLTEWLIAIRCGLMSHAQEFTVRDSTWHRVGPQNERFVLGRHQAPNGVCIGRSNSAGGIGGIEGGGGGDRGSKGLRADQINSKVRSPPRRRTILTPCQPPTCENSVPPDNATVKRGACCGDQAAFQTPDTRPNRLIEPRGGTRPPHRARGVCGRTADINARLAQRGGRGCGDGNGDVGSRKGARRVCLSSGQREGNKPVSVAKRAGAPLYVVQLSLSSQQREAAEDVENEEGASKTRAAGERRKDIVEIPCVADEGCDMYQLGRMQAAENDFVVKGPLHKSEPGGKVCGPVSRYAVRLLVDRSPPHRCRIFAGGFNSR